MAGSFTSLTRREFTGLVAACAALPVAGTAREQAAQSDYVPPPRPLVPDVPPFAGGLEFSLRPVSLAVGPVPLSQVRQETKFPDVERVPRLPSWPHRATS